MRILQNLLERASNLAEVEPAVALFLGAALLAVFLTALWPAPSGAATTHSPSFSWALYGHLKRLLWAIFLVLVLVGAVSVLRIYLRQSLGNFQGAHGRITQVNYNAVQSIWGAEQRQGELGVQLYQDREVIERIESEDLTKPALLRKKTVRQLASGNPFERARHDIVLRQSPRKKGSALYVGYETDCRFTWRLRNPAAEAYKGLLTFPLPSARGMYDELSATLNGQDVLPHMQIREGALVLERDVAPNETMDLAIAFKSRGMSYWYFQVGETREIRDFTLTLTLPDLPPARLNYPEGCMTPTIVQPSAAGSLLTYRLDHALSNKGMGVALPSLPQPGATTNDVLRETERAWLLIFALVALSLTLASVAQAVLLTVLFGAGSAFIYGLLGNLNDVLFGFWGTAFIVVLPLFLLLGVLLARVVGGLIGRLLAVQLFVFGLIYPCVAGLDDPRQGLYQNLCVAGLLAFIAWLLARRRICDFDFSTLRPDRIGTTEDG